MRKKKSLEEIIVNVHEVFDRYEDALPTLGAITMVKMIKQDILEILREEISNAKT